MDWSLRNAGENYWPRAENLKPPACRCRSLAGLTEKRQRIQRELCVVPRRVLQMNE